MSVRYSYFKKRPYLKLTDAQRICPACLKNGKRVLMSAGSSRELVTYYYCPTAGCDHSKKALRPPRIEVAAKTSDQIEFR